MNFNDVVDSGKVFNFFGVDNRNFKLNDIVFEVTEDESDGYRSYLDSVEVTDATGLIFFNAPIATVHVKESDDQYRKEYHLIDEIDGHIWLSFGTNNYDDYYPYFVFEYHPKLVTE